MLLFSDMQTLTVVTWNVGFAGMGPTATLRLSGGNSFIPSASKMVQKNMVKITDTLLQANADVFTLQELSSGSIVNMWHDMRTSISTALETHHVFEASSFAFPLFFRVLKNEHGVGTYIRNTWTVEDASQTTFSASELYYGFIGRRDRMLTTRIINENGVRLAIVNSHLASYDPRGTVRVKQLKELVAYVQSLYTDGTEVLVGADWNLHNNEATFCHGEELSELCACKFPFEHIPDGWGMHFPTNASTVRATNKPYRKGWTKTATIDGFLCSPGISVQDIQAIDLEFAYSDHNPVAMTISL